MLAWLKKGTFSFDLLAYDLRRMFVNGLNPVNIGSCVRTIEHKVEHNLTGSLYRIMCNDGTLLHLQQLRNWVLHIKELHEKDGHVPCFVYSTFSDHSGHRAFGTAVIPKHVWEDEEYAGRSMNKLKPERILSSKSVYCRVARNADEMQSMAEALDEIADIIREIGEVRQEEEA
tara:strand:+ start:1107 stop:1625 length:519 start_codon:yes stop_codon:yes gene_type:complete